ncbi:MAG: Tail-specific protease precursor [Myxococcales bacterium]|nr:Tail-specific protease precursor [Myxococcales bacterium]
MRRHLSRILLTVSMVACSGTAPTTTESSRPVRELPTPTTAASVVTSKPVPPPDPREAALSATVLELLQQDHLLHKRIDDDVSRAAFATYLDRLDSLKLFLLKSDRNVLAKHADKIDDELRAGSLDLAHEGAKIFAARVDVVDKVVAAILAAPMNHSDEEWIETDPKKIEPVATEDELRERWRQRLELEVLERVGQMETKLEAEAKRKAEKAKVSAKDKSGDKATAKDKLSAKHTGAMGSAAENPRVASSTGDKDADKDDRDDESSALPLAEIPPTPEAREAKARADLAKTYAGRFARLRKPEPLDAAADLINSVTSTLDPHTTYLPPADKANFDIALSGSLEGIGASLRERDHYIEIVELVPGGAAWRQGGLSPGDLIVGVQAEGKEPVDVIDMRIDDVVKMIRGPKGTVVRLRVQKPGAHEDTIAITRDVIVVEEAYARGAVLTRKGQKPFGYIHLPSFYGGSNSNARMASADIRRLLKELKAQKVAGVVLDIRSNGGGLLGDAVKLTGEFIDHGPVVQVRDSSGKREILSDEAKGTEFDGPMVVLVDRFSASASEILAGALQDYHRAIIVGTGPTHGKGTVQTLADLDRISGSKEELGSLKLTIEQFFLPSGSSTQLHGVTPDVLLPDPAGYIDAGETKLEHAIAWSKIDAAPHDDWAATWRPAVLAERSAARVAKNPILSKIATATQILKTRRDDTRVPLAEPAWETRRKELRDALEAASPDLKHAPPAFTVKTIEDPAAAVIAPGPGGKQDDRPARWRDALATDPWVAETVSILADMAK